jgi:hypothetical protein
MLNGVMMNVVMLSVVVPTQRTGTRHSIVDTDMLSRVTRRLEKKTNFPKNSPKSCKVKKGQNIYNKAQFESPKCLH